MFLSSLLLTLLFFVDDVALFLQNRAFTGKFFVNNFAKSGAADGGAAGALSPGSHTPPNGHISPGLGLPNGNGLGGVGDAVDAIVAGFGGHSHGGSGRGDMEA